MSGHYVASSANLARDGGFFILIPDVLRDPAIRTFRYPGEMAFVLADETSGEIIYRLNAIGQESQRVPVRPSYPDEQLFDAEQVGHVSSTNVPRNRDSRIQDALDRLR